MTENNVKQVELSSFLPYTVNKIAALFVTLYAVFLFSPVIGFDAGFVALIVNGLSLTKYLGVLVLALGAFLAIYSRIPSALAFVSLAKKAFNAVFVISLLIVLWSSYEFLSDLEKMAGRSMPNPFQFGTVPFVAAYVLGLVILFMRARTA